MTNDEQTAEKLRVIERYAELQSRIECLRNRVRGWLGYLSQIESKTGQAEHLVDCVPFLDNVVEKMGDVRADIDSLSKAIQERHRLEASLRRMNLEPLIHRP